MLKTTTT